jgi:hypothetical protein
MTRKTLPETVTRYLDSVRHELASLPASYRDDIVLGIESHIVDSLASGVDPTIVVTELGDPADVAAQAFEQYEQETGHDARPAYLTLKRVAQLCAFALTLGAVALALFLPLLTTVTFTGSGGGVTYGVQPGTISEMHVDDGGATLSFRSTWDAAGPIALLPALVPLTLAGVPLFLRGRVWSAMSISLTVLLLALAVIASATIGWFFLPAAALAVLALFLPGRARASMSPQGEIAATPAH